MHSIRRAASVVAVSALLATGTVGAVAYNVSPAALPAAAAQDSATPALSGIPSTANLHVHKLKTISAGEADGTKQNVEGEGAEGIEYSAYKLNGIDLTTQGGWTQAAAVDIDDLFNGNVQNAATLNTTVPALSGVQPTTEVTGEKGLAAFDDLDTGLYLVVEQADPRDNDGVAIAPSAAFLVTLPMTNPTGSGWLKTVHVYPKGQAFGVPTKVISDPTPTPTQSGVDLTGSSLGDKIDYDVSVTIPENPVGLTGLMFTDKLAQELEDGRIESIHINGTLLTTPDEYSTTPSRTLNGHDIIVADFQTAGLNILNNALATGEAKIEVKIRATLKAAPQNHLSNNAWFRRTAGPGEVTLPAEWDPVAEGDTPVPGAKSHTATALYGAVTFSNVDADDNVLTGVNSTFQLHRCEGSDDALEIVDETLPIAVGKDGSDTAIHDWTTTEGEGSIEGIHLGNLQGDVAANTAIQDIWADKGETFCLVETEAPEGYSLLPRPVKLNLTADASELVTADAQIKRVEANAGFNLPLTGGMGIWVALGGGALLLLIAAAYYAARNRKQA